MYVYIYIYTHIYIEIWITGLGAEEVKKLKSSPEGPFLDNTQIHKAL